MDELEQRAAVVAEQLSWVGTPYHHRGRLKGIGVDCAMYPAEVYIRCGLIPEMDTPAYPPDWHLNRRGERFVAEVERYARAVPEGLPGDLVIYRFGKCFAHGALIVAWPRITHAVLRLCVIEDNGDSPVLAVDPRHGPRERVFYRLRQWGDA